MDELIAFFEQVPIWFRASLLIGGLVVFWILEGILPLKKAGYQKGKHAGINIFFTVTTMIIGFGCAGTLLLVSNTVAQNNIGLLYLVDMPTWMQYMIGILLLDFIGAYLIHLVEHKVRWMWKFHLVHHSDTNIDVTSGLRHHPGETLFRMGFTLIAVAIVGAPISMIMLYQSLSVLFAHLTHANVSLFGKMDRTLSLLFVTPNMHKVHHHFRLPWTDTNFGNIFSIWDRLFGTFQYVDDIEDIKYGIDTHMKSEENAEIGNLLAIPFQTYRPPTASKVGSD